MRLNADFSQPIVIRPEDYEWRDSPSAGVQRMMLDRIGGEVARATSLVRFGPNASFAEHTHGGGEEFFVLEGAFGDEHEIYPAGSYVRNPVGTSHSPRVGPDGCLILVKLYQMDDDDQDQVVIDTNSGTWYPADDPGVEVLYLHEYGEERVALMRYAPDTRVATHRHPGGQEAFVIAGLFGDESGEYAAGTWIRNPPGIEHTPFSGPDGALVYLKVGHLAGQ
jgi:anti-sigma factor ChrR (cupin superfamily)